MVTITSSASDALIKSIVKENPDLKGKLHSSDVTITNTVVGPENDLTFNVKLISLPDTPLIGHRTFRYTYKRKSLSTLKGFGVKDVYLGNGNINTAHLITNLNKQHGLNLSVDDIDISLSYLTDIGYGVTRVLLKAKPESLYWEGSIELNVSRRNNEPWSIAVSGENYTHGSYAVTPDGYLYMFGGWYATQIKTIQKYHIATNTMSVCAGELPHSGSLAAAVYVDGLIYYFGDTTDLNMYVFNPVTETLTLHSTYPPGADGPIRIHTAVSYQGKIYASGKEGLSSSPDPTHNQIHVYDIATKTWSIITSPIPLLENGLVIKDDVLYVFGGWDHTNTVYLKNNYSYNITTGLWTRLADTPQGIYAAKGALHNNTILVTGVTKEATKDVVFAYDIKSDTWGKLCFSVGSPYQFIYPAMFVIDDRLYIAFPYDSPGYYLGRVYSKSLYSPST